MKIVEDNVWFIFWINVVYQSKPPLPCIVGVLLVFHFQILNSGHPQFSHLIFLYLQKRNGKGFCGRKEGTNPVG